MTTKATNSSLFGLFLGNLICPLGVSDSHYICLSPHGGHMPGTFFAYCGQLQTIVCTQENAPNFNSHAVYEAFCVYYATKS